MVATTTTKARRRGTTSLRASTDTNKVHSFYYNVNSSVVLLPLLLTFTISTLFIPLNNAFSTTTSSRNSKPKSVLPINQLPSYADIRSSSSSSSRLVTYMSTSTSDVPRKRKRDRFLGAFGITLSKDSNHSVKEYRRLKQRITIQRQQGEDKNRERTKRNDNNKSKQKDVIPPRIINTIEDLHDHWNDTQGFYRKNNDEIDYTALVRGAKVIGNTQMIGSSDFRNYTHPVAQLMHDRVANDYNLNNKNDQHKIALVVEGGGMRGCVSAGMVCAIHYLNLTNTIDAIYGASAGTIVAAYLITEQISYFGPELYYDSLTTAGRNFIDTRRLLRAIGLGLLDPRLYKDVLLRPDAGKPVLNLNFLLKQTVQKKKQLDWDKFASRQKSIPLNVIVSALREERSYALNMHTNNAFTSLEELTDAMHASCLLPGIAGPAMNINKDYLSKRESSLSSNTDNGKPKYILGNSLDDPNYEPLADALLFEPMPYQTAVNDGATHVLVIRSRPDGVDVTGKGGTIENMIAHRFFVRKNNLPNMYQRLKQQLHKKLYGENVIFLNNAANVTNNDNDDKEQKYYMTMALPPGSTEVSRLEVNREAIFQGLRRGFARAYDCLVEDPEQRGKGAEAAKLFFPDEILQYDPNALNGGPPDESAFVTYMKQNNVVPKVWEQHNHQYDQRQQQQQDTDAGTKKPPLEPPPPIPKETRSEVTSTVTNFDEDTVVSTLSDDE